MGEQGEGVFDHVAGAHDGAAGPDRGSLSGDPSDPSTESAQQAYAAHDWRPDPVAERGEGSKTRLVLVSAVATFLLTTLGAGVGVAFLTHNNADLPVVSGLVATIPSGGITLTTAQIAKAVDPAVVDVYAIVPTAGGQSEVAGTGVIAASDGEIITNNHVVAGAISIHVTVMGRGTFSAHVTGTNVAADVAVLQLSNVSGLRTVTFADSSLIKIGDPVVAIGNAGGLGGAPSVTVGVVSGLDASITASGDNGDENLSGMIQTDAPIFPGDSGGPLVDSSGDVIGIDTAAATKGIEIGFALPINRVLEVVNEIEQGSVSRIRASLAT
jgi:S1-C subfamily serine protease